MNPYAIIMLQMHWLELSMQYWLPPVAKAKRNHLTLVHCAPVVTVFKG